MFQNIAKDFEETQNSYEDVELNKKERIKEVIKKCISKKMLIVYAVSFLLSCVSFNINKELAPFGIAALVALLSNCIPIGIASIFTIAGTSLAFGGTAVLNLLLTLFLVFFSILIKSPKLSWIYIIFYTIVALLFRFLLLESIESENNFCICFWLY